MELGDPAEQLIDNPYFRWCEGMRDARGRRIVDVELYDGESLPDLTDYPTAGALLGLLAEAGKLTDVVRQDGIWIVAVEVGEDVQGYAADLLGEAAAWALLAIDGGLDGLEEMEF